MAKPKTNPEKFTVQQVAEALRATGGINAPAAALLEQTTKRSCTGQTVANYIRRHPALQELVKDIHEEVLDLTESALLQGIRAGNPTCIIFKLKTHGKARGYVERQEVTGANGGPVQTQDVKHLDLSKLSDKELEALEAIYAKAGDDAGANPQGKGRAAP